MAFSSDQAKIVRVDSPQAAVLRQKTRDIGREELLLARDIADKLLAALTPLLPAAGLAAPQIGISRSVFIYSFDRNPQHLEVVVNPSFEPIGSDVTVGWESCFSAMKEDGTVACCKLARFEKIKASYLNLDGAQVEKILTGFGAKVFQHEYDHLQGYVNVHKEPLETKNFLNAEEFQIFMQAVKKEDASRYEQPK